MQVLVCHSTIFPEKQGKTGGKGTIRLKSRAQTKKVAKKSAKLCQSNWIRQLTKLEEFAEIMKKKSGEVFKDKTW